MAVQPDKFLLPEEDGLPVRVGHEYTRKKLRIVSGYLDIAQTALRERKWRTSYYIDLFAGSGKNQIGEEVVLGSPLLALKLKYPFLQYRFNELDAVTSEALQKRSEASPLRDSIRVHQEDANVIVNQICNEIDMIDKEYLPGKYSSFNIAFLDPQRLKELKWTTVERLASVAKMDLIILFSTSGFTRAVIPARLHTVGDQFFGTDEWRPIAFASTGESAEKRRNLIDLYRSRLRPFGYHIETDYDFGSGDVPFKNTKNVQVYSLIFASKHPLGDDFWRKVTKGGQQPKLPGL